MSAAANVTEWLLWALHLVTHSYDLPGGMWFHPGFLRTLERRSFSVRDGSPEPGPPSRPELPRRLGEYPVAAMLDEIESGNLRALFVLGGNPITAFPEPSRVRKALDQLEVLVVADVVRTAVTDRATHVFACADQLERADLPVFIDQFVPLVMTRYAPPVFPAKFDRKPLWWPFAQLAERLGFDVLDGLDPNTATDDDLLRPLGDRSRSTFDEIRRRRVVVDDPSQLFGWVHDHVLPGGRWRLAPEPLVAQLATLEATPPLTLIPRRQVRHLNSQLTDGVGGRRDPAAVLVNPADAIQAGIGHGDRVMVRSANGSLVGVAEVTDAIRPGAVSVPHGFEEPNVGRLTSAAADVDPLTGMVLQSGLAVELRAELETDSP
jgi:anaerobic selenocysteine-containing dehydrogenase